jgi:hypothetical protein
VAEAVVVVEVAVAEAEGQDTLLEEIGEGMLEAFGVAVIGKAGGERVEEVERGLDLAAAESAGVGGDGAAVARGDDGTGSEILEGALGGGTGCQGAMVWGLAARGCCYSLYASCGTIAPVLW